MRVVAGVAGLFLIIVMAAGAQYQREPATTLAESGGVSCMEPAAPVDLKHPGKDAKAPTPTPCRTMAPVEGCPVDMRVRQRMAGAAIAADVNGVKRKVSAQKLRLILNDLRRDNPDRKAVSAIVTVHGTGGKARMQGLGTSSGNDLAKSFSVDLASWGEPGVSGDFLLPGFTSASRVDLESVTYEDGSTWKLAQNESCRVAVDPMMLVGR